MCSHDVSQCGLGKQACGTVCIGDILDGHDGIKDVEIYNGINKDGHAVLREDLLERRETDNDRWTPEGSFPCFLEGVGTMLQRESQNTDFRRSSLGNAYPLRGDIK